MRRVLAGIACLLMLAAGPGAWAAHAEGHAEAPSPFEVIRLVNEFRASNGMPPLEVNDALMTAAQRHADWQAISRINSHQGEGGSTPRDRAAAAGYKGAVNENVASGTIGFATPDWAVNQGWANSSVHRAAMLSKSAHIGVGTAENSEFTYYVLLVGNPSGWAAPPAPTSGAAKFPTQAGGAEAPTEPAGQTAPVAPVVIATAGDDGSVVHVVQEGQTAWTIAAWYGIPLDELLALNHLGENAVLHPGDRVIIRQGAAQMPSPSPGALALTGLPTTPPPVDPSPTPTLAPPPILGPDGLASTGAVIGAVAAGVLILLGVIAMEARKSGEP